MKITYHSEEPDGKPQPPAVPSFLKRPGARTITMGITLLLIAYAVLDVFAFIGILAFMSMDTAFRPGPCIPFVITPVIVLLIPSVVGLLKMKRWGVYLSIIFLIIFGIIPSFQILQPYCLGIPALILPLVTIYWLVSNHDHFAGPNHPKPKQES